jgi:putative inorganic carbon (HCO3(-)) transporter
MGFRAYILYLFMVFVRPIEQFAPDLMAYRPILILWIVTFLASLVDGRSRRSAAEPIHHRLLAGMALVIALSLFFGEGLSSVAGGLGDFSTPAMIFVLTCMNVNTFDRFKFVIRAFIFFMAILCAEGLAAYYLGFKADELVISQLIHEDIDAPADLPLIPANDDSGTLIWRLRSVGFLQDPNDFAQTLVMALPLLLIGVAQGVSWRMGLLCVAPLASLFSYVIYLTHSRGGLVGLGAMLLFALKRRIGNWRTAGLLLICFAAFQMLDGGAGRGLSSKEQSASERIEAWSDGMLMMKSSPLLGVGYGKFIEHHIRTAHNSYVLCFSEVGLLGYFLWMGLIVLSVKSLSRLTESLPSGSPIARDALLLQNAMVGFLVCAWFLSRTFIPTLYILLALAVCLLHCARQLQSPSENALLHQPLRWVGASVVVMAASIAAVSAFIRASTL